ncbi:MAG: Ryanodine receptor Ryr [Acidobacteria bacterium]|nr:MAG: Ryanodine receptor Ryr [Acidobacteriota bacterium]MCE7959365.1 Ryanodine receptor Ryr [Acidobacteria bacterium ACB2]
MGATTRDRPPEPGSGGAAAYIPRPIDTAGVEVPPGVSELTELLARNTHENWAAGRLADGWRWGPVRDDERREHPCLVPYDELPEEEREYDRRTALETVRTLLALGYRIVKP